MALFKKLMGYDEEVSDLKTDNRKEPAVKRFVTYDKSNMKTPFELAEYLKKGYPLLINFEGIDQKNANKAIQFLAGACYMLDGKVIKLKSSIFIFCDQESLKDGTIMDLVNRNKKGVRWNGNFGTINNLYT